MNMDNRVGIDCGGGGGRQRRGEQQGKIETTVIDTIRKIKIKIPAVKKFVVSSL